MMQGLTYSRFVLAFNDPSPAVFCRSAKPEQDKTLGQAVGPRQCIRFRWSGVVGRIEQRCGRKIRLVFLSGFLGGLLGAF